MNKTSWASAAVAAALLAACGGGDGDTPPVTSFVPSSANATIPGYVAYLQALVTVQDDTLSPVNTADVVPPTDDTSPPTKVD